MNHLLPALLASSSLVLLSLPAQSGELTCRLVVVDARTQAPEDLRLVDPASGAVKRIEAGNSIEAESVEISNSGNLLVRSGRDGETIAELSFDPNLSEAILFLVPSEGLSEGEPDEEGSESEEDSEGESEGGSEGDGDSAGDQPGEAVPWSCLLAELSPDELDKGGLAFVNGSGRPARVTLGSVMEPVEAAATRFFGDPQDDKDDFNMVPVKVEIDVDGRWRRLKDGASRFAGDVTYWFVSYDQPGSGRPRLRIFKTEP